MGYHLIFFLCFRGFLVYVLQHCTLTFKINFMQNMNIKKKKEQHEHALSMNMCRPLISNTDADNYAFMTFCVEPEEMRITYTRMLTKLLRLEKEHKPSEKDIDNLEVLGDFINGMQD